MIPAAISRLGEIRAPTLLAVGALDYPEIVQRTRLLERSIEGATLAVLDGLAFNQILEEDETGARAALALLEQAGEAFRKMLAH